WQGRDRGGAVLAGRDRAHHPSVQSVHLFYLLTSRSVRRTTTMKHIDAGIRDQAHPPRSREDVAQGEVGHTEMSPRLARVLTVCCLAAIVLVPTGQHVHEFLQWRASQRPSPVPQAWDILRSARGAASMWRWSPLAPADRVFAVNRWLLREIKHYEDHLEEESWLMQRVLPPAQMVLSRLFGVGNEKVYRGRGDWLFYRPGIENLAGHGFLTPRQLAHPLASGN